VARYEAMNGRMELNAGFAPDAVPDGLECVVVVKGERTRNSSAKE